MGQLFDGGIMTDWQPIETAPKDGTSILLYGYWEGEIDGIEDEKNIWMAQYMYGDWLINGGNCYGSYVRNPTYWMPLPEPPK